MICDIEVPFKAGLTVYSYFEINEWLWGNRSPYISYSLANDGDFNTYVMYKLIALENLLIYTNLHNFEFNG